MERQPQPQRNKEAERKQQSITHKMERDERRAWNLAHAFLGWLPFLRHERKPFEKGVNHQIYRPTRQNKR